MLYCSMCGYVWLAQYSLFYICSLSTSRPGIAGRIGINHVGPKCMSGYITTGGVMPAAIKLITIDSYVTIFG